MWGYFLVVFDCAHGAWVPPAACRLAVGGACTLASNLCNNMLRKKASPTKPSMASACTRARCQLGSDGSDGGYGVDGLTKRTSLCCRLARSTMRLTCRQITRHLTSTLSHTPPPRHTYSRPATLAHRTSIYPTCTTSPARLPVAAPPSPSLLASIRTQHDCFNDVARRCLGPCCAPCQQARDLAACARAHP